MRFKLFVFLTVTRGFGFVRGKRNEDLYTLGFILHAARWSL